MGNKKTGELKIQFGKYVDSKKKGQDKEFVGEEPFKISDVFDNGSYSFTVQKIEEDKSLDGITMSRGSEIWTFSDGKNAFKIFIE